MWHSTSSKSTSQNYGEKRSSHPYTCSVLSYSQVKYVRTYMQTYFLKKIPFQAFFEKNQPPPRCLVGEFLNNAPHTRPNPYPSLVHHHPLCWPPHRSPPPSPYLMTLHHKQVYTATQKNPAARIVARRGATRSETQF